MPLVAGVDSSTQSCKVQIRSAETGEVVREGRAPHPAGTEVDPGAWWSALESATAAAGGLDDVDAVSVAGQQHGMVCLDGTGQVVRPALLWNDARSAAAAADLTAELGANTWAQEVGVVPVSSFTISKLRWLADNEPRSVDRTEAVCLPHDWLTWRLAGSGDTADLITDRSDASGTGYWSSVTAGYREDLLERALGRTVRLPRVLGPSEASGLPGRLVLGPGAGDNAGAALGLGAEPGDVVLSLGTSGVASAVSPTPATDASGTVAGFADATGRYLPLVATLNAAGVLDAAARVLGVSLTTLSDLALQAPAGAQGLCVVPYLDGERTPNLPSASGSVLGLTHANATPQHFARAAVEGMLCGIADALDHLVANGASIDRILLVGGAAVSPAVRAIAPMVTGRPILIPPSGEYVARGAARQAAWVLSGESEPPPWSLSGIDLVEADPDPAIRERYAEARHLHLSRLPQD